MKIKFCGAASGVTGSCHLVSWGEHKILLDCGQFQGGKAQERQNYEDFPFDPTEIECLILSHAHIDHCGRIPLLIKRGFKGDIYCTDPTADLLEVMLKDSGYIHEKEAEWQNRKNQRAGRPEIQPLYTFNDAVASLKYIKPVRYDQLIEINQDLRLVFNEAGHILGSAIVELWIAEGEQVSKLVFSGDIGVSGRPILRDPTIIKKADYVIMETTYGNRLHPKETSGFEALLEIVIKTTRRGGTVVIPSFAVGRTQELLYEFNKYYEKPNKYQEDLKNIKVYVDSPMAKNATEVFQKNSQVFDKETKDFILGGDNPLIFDNLAFIKSTEESKLLNQDNSPKIIISASGMCEAGRIRHHLKHNLWDSRASVVFVGYQAEGTLGRALIEGLKEVSLFGEPVQVNAEIYNLEGFSGHGDKEDLLHWVEGFQVMPREIFLVHGELEAKEDFARAVRERVGYEAIVVRGVVEYDLDTGYGLKREETIGDIMDNEAVETLKWKISEIHQNLEQLLYDGSLSIGGNGADSERTAEVNNIIMDLEKNMLSLGTALTKR